MYMAVHSQGNCGSLILIMYMYHHTHEHVVALVTGLPRLPFYVRGQLVKHA